jgi:hypothetical protein
VFVGSDEPGTTTTSAADFVNAANSFPPHQQQYHQHGGEEFWMEQPFDMSQLAYPSAEGHSTEFGFNAHTHPPHPYQHHQQQHYGQLFDRQSPQEHLHFADLSVSR